MILKRLKSLLQKKTASAKRAARKNRRASAKQNAKAKAEAKGEDSGKSKKALVGGGKVPPPLQGENPPASPKEEVPSGEVPKSRMRKKGPCCLVAKWSCDVCFRLRSYLFDYTF